MKLAEVLAIIFTVIVFVFSIIKLKGFKLSVKSIVRIGLVAAITMVLYMIKLVPFPQGGGCSLLSILPIMMLSVMFGMEEGIICAVIVALIKIVIQPPYYPLQIPLDYFGSMIAVAFVPLFGVENKFKIILGAVFASIISILFSVFSGVIFFGQFAPKGTNVWVYSIGYNVLGYGVEALLSIVVLSILPLIHIKEAIKRGEIKR
ncbi:energy-coupled thiamine transporter ThiT [Haloimpatiens sp. FM7315]|uniref:energy-coupled thiamine transporter ThiT n=1 Tax=Haloimpatiens sp. FM7315 TaxID=3298609 RepID=UPI0035A2EF19